MSKIKVVNIKCGGCAAQIKSALEKEGVGEVSVDVENQEVSFLGEIEKAKAILEKLGYPEAGSPAAQSIFKKAQSFISCAIGKTKK